MWELDHREGWCFQIVVKFEILMLSNCGAGELLWVAWLTRRSNQLILQEINPEYSLEGWMLKLKLQYLATWCEELTHWKRPWCWERLRAGREGNDRGWDGWMTSSTRWTWVWVDAGSWWWTRRPGVLQFMGSQIVRHNLATELNWLWLSLRFEDLHLLRSSFFVCDNSIPNKTSFVKSKFLSWLYW